ncbi:MAG: CPBP family glutamic-type intramembrane protease [Candidatus Dormibacterales bacterium]
MAPLPLIWIANLGVARAWARGLTFVVAYALAGATAVLGLLDLGEGAAGLTPARALSVHGGLAFLVTGVLGGLALTEPARRAVGRVTAFDPESPVHALALCGTILLAGFFIGTQLSTDVLAQEASASHIGVGDLAAQEVPFLAAALLGVGLLARRGPREALARLGLVRPLWWHVALALAVAGLLFAAGNLIDAAGQALDPNLMRRVNRASQQVFGGLGGPLGIASLAIIPALCEESLFRGALQPKLGIVWVALVFATFHAQYGLSFDSLAVFVLACGLGLVRKFTNTTSSAVAHGAYNLLVGVGLGGGALLAGAGVELALLVVLVAVLFRARASGERAARL